MQFNKFVGIDISKKTLNVAVFDLAKNLLYECKIGNNKQEIGALVRRLRKLLGNDLSQVLFCLEHTGVYQTPFIRYGEGEGLVMWLANPRSVINASEEEEKDDRLDARKIGIYAIRYTDKFHQWERPSPVLEQLGALEGHRAFLKTALSGLRMRINEAREMGDTVTAGMARLSRRTERALEKDLADIEREIKEIVTGDEAVGRNIALLRTIPGIGERTAIMLVVATLNFTRFKTARQFAKYCCVAPVHKQSGTSRKGRGKVNKHGRLDIKALLTLAAWSAMRHDTEIRLFYERKCATTDRKNKVVNMVRNKLIKRAFAIIARQTPYEREWNPRPAENSGGAAPAPVRQRQAVAQPGLHAPAGREARVWTAGTVPAAAPPAPAKGGKPKTHKGRARPKSD